VTPPEEAPPQPEKQKRKRPFVVPSGAADWQKDLIYKSGIVAHCVSNALSYFNNHPDWKGKLAWNEFTGELQVRDKMPFPVSLTAGDEVRDHHDTLIQTWFERETRNPKWGIDTIRRAVDCWAKQNSFNPIKDYLNGLPEWDRVPRLDRWLMKYCNAGPAKDMDSEEALKVSDFISAIGARWWISMIARAFEPGCKVHHVLVLEGAKGIGKTSLASVIFGGYHAIIHGDVNSKDNMALLSSGVWGVVLDEFDVLNKTEMKSIKSWVTEEFAKFRPVWGHRHEKRPRQCVFIATVNGDDWAQEEDRRWWPVACGDIDFEGVKRDRDLLMAEALFRYRAHERWYLHSEEDKELIETAKGEQLARVPDNVLAPLIIEKAIEVCEKQTGILYGSASVADILTEIGLSPEKRQSIQSQVGKVLRSAGWKKITPRIKGKQSRRYRDFNKFPDIQYAFPQD
jgi:putative DNA primase/helicase